MANNTNKYCDVATATGEYSCLRVDLVFARELSFYIVTIYVPCFMIVVVSWFSFWLDYKAVILTSHWVPHHPRVSGSRSCGSGGDHSVGDVHHHG